MILLCGENGRCDPCISLPSTATIPLHFLVIDICKHLEICAESESPNIPTSMVNVNGKFRQQQKLAISLGQ